MTHSLSAAALAVSAAVFSLFGAGELAAQSGAKRAVTHDDYADFPRIRDTAYSRDGKWMAYSIRPAIGDGVLHLREVDGDGAHEIERGQEVTFSNDGRLAIFRIGKSKEEERRKKIEKLHEKAEEKKEGEEPEEEEEGTIPPDIKKALAERGISEAQAMAMIEQQGASMAEVRGFLGLEAPSGKKSGGGKSGGKDEEDAEAKALEKRLHVLDLSTGAITEIERVKSFRHPDDSNLLVLHMEKPEEEKKDKGDKEEKEEEKEGEEAETSEPEKKGEEAKEEKKKEPKDPLEKKRKDGTDLIVRDLAGGEDVVIPNVLAQGLIADDTWLWYTVGTKKAVEGVEHGFFARELSTGRTVTLLAGYSNVRGATTDREDTRLAFTSDHRTFGEDDAESDIYLWDFSDAAARQVVTPQSEGIPADHRIHSSGLSFSRDGSVLSFSVRLAKPEDLPKILDEDEVKMDMWSWRDGLLQTMQAKRGKPSDVSMTAVYHGDLDRVVTLGTIDSPRVSMVTEDGSRGLQADSKPYEQMVTWDGRYSDYYLVNTVDGSREKIIEGLRGTASASPGGRYVIWFDHRDYDWHVIDVHSHEHRNLTADIPVAFDREIDDRPEPHRAHGVAGWTEFDGEVLIHDAFDVWAIDPVTGENRCVTDGLGRAKSLQLRVTRTDLRPDSLRDDDEERRFLAGTLVLRAIDQETYAQGYYTDVLDAAGKPRKLIMTDQSIGGLNRPEDADRLFMTFSRFDRYPDLWTSDLAFEGARKLTDVGTVVDQFRWGHAELVNWRSDDGVDLKGYLIKPDGFDPSEQYPMMVYFYERSSQGIHRFVTPTTGTSPNAAYYVSNGYLWFVPDIVYTDGYPGESAEKCVVSGVQHLIAQGFVDRESIGAAGHSWGGYQTAHLITRTNIFAAVESGAPVVNMFSAYGGIRWSSGMSRQFQYEQTQSRIGGTIWEYPMRYWENSPLYHLDKVETPVLILHNDQDGAVPWYQGIEFLTAMRRLGKEAYMANYNGEDHGLRKEQNKRDWTRRMQEFFDHHLKGAPAPEWMTAGIPYHQRMAEKIPHAPSYREAVEAGLIQTKEAIGDQSGGR